MEDRKDVTDNAALTTAPLDFATIKALMERWAAQGWIWVEADHALVDPADRRRFVRIDPATHRPTLSPELARHLASMPEDASSRPQP